MRSGIASAELEWPLAPDHGQPRTGGSAQGGIGLRPADRPRGSRCLPAASVRLVLRVTRRSANSRSTGGFGPCPERSRRPRERERNGSRASSAPPSPAPRSSLAGVEPVPVRHLAEAAEYFRGERDPPHARRRSTPTRDDPSPDLADVRGQERARRALEIAAAGGHNLLLAGPPGIGKTMLARRLPGILPPLDPERCARGDADPLGRRACFPAAVARLRTPPFRAPHHTRVRGGHRGRRTGVRGPARRRSRTTACCSSTSCPSSRGRSLEALRQPLEDGIDRRRPCRRPSGLPGSLPARRDDEPLPLRRPRRPGRGVHLLAAPARPRTATGSRGRCSTASTSSSRSLGRARASWRRRPASRRQPCGSASAARGARVAGHVAVEPRGAGRSSPAPSIACRSRAAAARASLGSRERSPRSRGAARRAGAPRRGAVVPLTDRARRGMTELALAVFAAARDEHASDRDAGGAAVSHASPRAFDARSLRRGARAQRACAGSRAATGCFPLASRRSTTRRRVSSSAAAARPSCWPRRLWRSSARASCTDYGAHVARSLGRELAARRRRCRLGPRPRHRRLGAPRRARGGGSDGRRPRLRHRPRLPARARRARGADRRGRAHRLRVPARRRAGAVAVPGPQPDRRRPLRRDGRRRGPRAERRPDHRRPRAGGGTRGARRPGRDHVEPLRRDERSAPARRDAGYVLPPTCSRRSASRRRPTATPPSSTPGDAAARARGARSRGGDRRRGRPGDRPRAGGGRRRRSPSSSSQASSRRGGGVQEVMPPA